MSSPGPPKLSTATVTSHATNGIAATRDEPVQCDAAHTSAAVTNPLINPLIGNGTGPR